MSAINRASWGKAVGALALLAAMPLLAHHSFAAYDMTAVRLMTGVVTRVNPDANHLQIFFAAMNPERKNERARQGRQAHHLVRGDGGFRSLGPGWHLGNRVPARHGVQRRHSSPA